MKIAWDSMTAEEVVETVKEILSDKPVVLGPWFRDFEGKRYRKEEAHDGGPGHPIYVFVSHTLTNTRSDTPWFVDVVRGSVVCFPETTFHESEERAMASAVEAALRRGWKLMKESR